MRRAGIFPALFSLISCGPAEAPPAAPAPAAVVPEASAAPAPVASVAPAPRPSSPCGDLLEQNDKTLAVPADSRPEGDVDLTTACFPTPKGAWGLRLIEWKRDGVDDLPTYAGGLEVTHHSEGKETTWRPPQRQHHPSPGIPLWYGLDHSHISKPKIVDIDGDGEPEIFLLVGQKFHEGPYVLDAHLLTWKGGAVAPYPGLPASIEDLEDVDNDGHMDIIYTPYTEERESPCSGFGYQWTGPRFLAHGLAGGRFSTDDGAAKSFLKKSCPEAPKKPKKAKKGDRQPEDAALPELCARLWGKGERESLALLRGECRAPKNSDEACQQPAGVCGDYAERERAVKKAPALVLGKP